MGKVRILSLRILIILIICVSFLFAACNKNHENNFTEKNDLSPVTGPEEIQASADPNDDIDEIDEALPEDVNDREQDAYYCFVVGDGVRMREEASINSNIILQLNHGTKVEMIDKESDWIKVNFENIQGYVRSDLLSTQKPNERIKAETAEEVTEEVTEETDEAMIEETAAIQGDAMDNITNPKIIIRKYDRILELWDGGSLYGSYPIGLGWSPVGDKQKEGDGRTPEGTYYVCTRNNFSRFYLSLGVSYPNNEDAKEALEAGVIDQRTFQLIEDAINQNTTPPWNTAMGGEIMIHGHGAQSDWTAGCIAVDNNIMDILWDSCPLGTPIIIEP